MVNSLNRGKKDKRLQSKDKEQIRACKKNVARIKRKNNCFKMTVNEDFIYELFENRRM